MTILSCLSNLSDCLKHVLAITFSMKTGLMVLSKFLSSKWVITQKKKVDSGLAQTNTYKVETLNEETPTVKFILSLLTTAANGAKKIPGASTYVLSGSELAHESSKRVRIWVKENIFPKHNDLKRLSRLPLQMLIQLGCLFLIAVVFSRKIDHLTESISSSTTRSTA